jgi:glc operon protein GlcG
MRNRKLRYLRILCHDLVTEAVSRGMNVSVHAVDMAGRTTLTMRSDNAPYLSDEPARKKALASMMLRMPTNGAIKMLESDPIIARAMNAIEDILIVPGGMPLFLDDEMIGAIGVAGGHYKADHELLEKIVPAATKKYQDSANSKKASA